jgi:hypothetical protein
LGKLEFVVTKWRHDVPWSWQCFSAHEKGDLSSAMSLFPGFYLRRFCLPLFGFFRLVPGFVEFDSGA